ncbi:MAG TPA: nucleotidyltransferase domain-containing protein [Candidatus Norongarragalinales archaeon]|nr:nucleotidyltransferase domain-containing protein [Candidatus Norongarragalinales archaeon]
MGPKSALIERRVGEFAKRVHETYPDTKMYLFGSRARGDYLKSSDYDFIIISGHFEGQDFLERITEVLRRTKVNFAAEILCYTPAEFAKKRKQIGTVQSAMKDAIPL